MTDSSANWLFVGCYTTGAGGEGEGISVARRNPVDGSLVLIGTAAPSPAPSFVVRHPTLPVVYAVNELDDGAASGFALAPDGGLTPLGRWSTGGGFPCHLAVASGSLVAANYGTGSVAALRLDAHGVPDGQLDVTVHKGHGPDRERQDGPHAHMVVPTATGVLAVDLGIDRILHHTIIDGRITSTTERASLPPGAGPRHLVADPTGRTHVVGELDPVVTTFDPRWQAVGTVRTTTAPHAQPSEVDISADGRFLYVGNRGPDTIGVIDLDRAELTAEVSCGGAWPRHFVVTGRHLYVANERSNQISVFGLDSATGVPHPIDGGFSTPTPTCVLPL